MPRRVLPALLLALAAPALADVVWEPFVEPYGQIFPSLELATATLPADPAAEDPTLIGDPQGLIGVSLEGARPGARFELVVRVPGWARDSRLAGRIPQGDGDITLTPTIAWDYPALAANRQPRPATVEFELRLAGEVVETRTLRVRLRSVNDALYYIDEPDDAEDLDFNWLFAAYVHEEHPAVEQILKEALDAGVVDGFSGYQQADRDAVLKQAHAVWHVLQQRGIRYSSITRTASEHTSVRSQHVRFIDESLAMSQANCVDGSVLIASVLRKIDLAPVLVLVPGHMLVGFALDARGERWAWLETTLLGVAPPTRLAGGPRAQHEGKAKLAAAIDASLASFEAALDAGQRQIDAADGAFDDPHNRDYQLIDIQAARELGVMPIAR